MAIVAVAGGTGGIGRAIVDAITSRGRHTVKILSRKVDDSLSAELGVPIIAVDYSNIETLTKVFEDHEVDTVISTLFTVPVEGMAPEVAMIRAAQASKTTTRFIPSNWGLPMRERFQGMVPMAAPKLEAAAELRKSDLEHTVLYPGFLLDYYSGPSIKSYMAPLVVVIDITYSMAAIPGSGNTPVVFTHTLDIAKYVDAILDFEKWELEYRVIGDRATWNEFVKLAEDVKGTRFTVIYDSVEDLEAGKVTVLPSVEENLPMSSVSSKEVMVDFLRMFGLLFEDGSFDIKDGRSLNELIPRIVPLKIKQALEAAVKAA